MPPRRSSRASQAPPKPSKPVAEAEPDTEPDNTSDSESEDVEVVVPATRRRVATSMVGETLASSSSTLVHLKKVNGISEAISHLSSTPVAVSDASSVHPAAPASSETSMTRFCRRFWSSLAMFLAFCYFIHLGQPALLTVVVLSQFAMYREIVHIAYSSLLKDASHLPLFRTQNWYWFFVTLFFVYGRVATTILNLEYPRHHMFYSFCLLVLGFVGFVFSLRKGMLRLQFSMFAWMLLTLVFVVLQSSALVDNMFQGLFWFVLPAILIISNDSWAYVWGILFGRTPLIALSPRKTWEGFTGAFISTMLTAYFVSGIMIQFPILYCPQNTLTTTHPTCVRPDVFNPVTYNLPFPIFGLTTITAAPVQWHAIVMGLFASLVAPFGGFFASGFKRAFKVKDFGSLIPGHGGITDRMDCQLLMGLFVYVYYWSFVVPPQSPTIDDIYNLALQLNATNRQQLVSRLIALKP